MAAAASVPASVSMSGSRTGFRRRGAAAGAVLALLSAASAPAADRDRLLWHVEAADGTVVWTKGADTSFNPASVVKVGTTLWALERLGADHQFVTRVGVTGPVDPDTGEVDGALAILGGGDPDLHPENAFLVAEALGALGVRRVRGGLVVAPPFHFGWEHGVAGRTGTERERTAAAADRFRVALDPSGWTRAVRHAWEGFRDRTGAASPPPGVAVEGAVSVADDVPVRWLLEHRSNPLPDVLRRFNAYSNNDIVRIADLLGGTAPLESWMRGRLEAPDLELETSSGEGRNRMTARNAVRLVGELAAAARSRGLEPGELLPVLGCDPGPTRRMFPLFLEPARSGRVTVKTGTLTSTDGGVAVLAGLLAAADGREIRFCVAAPRAGDRLQHWRGLQQAWLEELVARVGGARRIGCGPDLPYSETGAEVVVLGR